MAAGTDAAPAKPILPLFLCLILAALFVMISDASGTWLAMIFLACCALSAAFWFRDLQRVLLFMLIVTTPIDISKALVIPGGVYSPGLSLFTSDLFTLALILLWLLRLVLVRGAEIRIDRLHAVAFVFLGWLWISALHSDSALAGILAAVTYTKFFAVYFVLTQLLRKPEDLQLVLNAAFVGFLVQAVYIFAQLLTGSALEVQGAKTTHLGTELVFENAGGLHAFRPSGFLHHPNVLAHYLIFLLPTAAALSLLGKKTIGAHSWFAALLMLLMGLTIMLITLSRGGWIALGVAAIFFVIVGVRRGLLKRRHVTGLILTAFMALALLSILYPAAYLRVTQSDQRSSESRWVMMDQALLIIRNHPWIGVGLGGYNGAAQNYTPESFSSVSVAFQDEIRKGVVHNKYLLVAAETGLIGLALFLNLLWRFFREIFPLSRWRSMPNFALALGLSSGILGQAVAYAFDHFYADVRIAVLYVSFGMYHALINLQREHSVPARVRGPHRLSNEPAA